MSADRYAVVVHGRWLDTEPPQATVIRSRDGWTWHDMCTTDPDTADEIAEALRYVAEDRAERAAAERAEVERLMEGMELAWGLIANGQYWDRTDGRRYGEWNEARERLRDEHWHPALDRNKEARRER